MALVYLTTLACANGGEPAPRARAAAPQPGGPLVVFLGDSLTAGYGLPQDDAFPAVLGRTMGGRGTPIRVVNAGVSGDTTGGGLDRLDWLLAQKPDVLVVGLGANDALRGQELAAIEANLRAIVERAKAAGVRVLLLGMRLPTSYGPAYTRGFSEIYPRVAADEKVALVPFLLDRVGGRAELNLDDGIHPNAEGHKLVAENVAPHLIRLVEAKR